MHETRVYVVSAKGMNRGTYMDNNIGTITRVYITSAMGMKKAAM